MHVAEPRALQPPDDIAQLLGGPATPWAPCFTVGLPAAPREIPGSKDVCCGAAAPGGVWLAANAVPNSGAPMPPQSHGPASARRVAKRRADPGASPGSLTIPAMASMATESGSAAPTLPVAATPPTATRLSALKQALATANHQMDQMRRTYVPRLHLEQVQRLLFEERERAHRLEQTVLTLQNQNHRDPYRWAERATHMAQPEAQLRGHGPSPAEPGKELLAARHPGLVDGEAIAEPQRTLARQRQIIAGQWQTIEGLRQALNSLGLVSTAGDGRSCSTAHLFPAPAAVPVGSSCSAAPLPTLPIAHPCGPGATYACEGSTQQLSGMSQESHLLAVGDNGAARPPMAPRARSLPTPLGPYPSPANIAAPGAAATALAPRPALPPASFCGTVDVPLLPISRSASFAGSAQGPGSCQALAPQGSFEGHGPPPADRKGI